MQRAAVIVPITLAVRYKPIYTQYYNYNADNIRGQKKKIELGIWYAFLAITTTQLNIHLNRHMKQ